MSERLGKIHFWISFVAFNLTFFPMHILACMVCPGVWPNFGKYPSFAHFASINVFITHAAFLLGAAQILLVNQLHRKLVFREEGAAESVGCDDAGMGNAQPAAARGGGLSPGRSARVERLSCLRERVSNTASAAGSRGNPYCFRLP